MRHFKFKMTAVILVIIMVFHIVTAGFLGSQQVKAGFWDEHKDSVFTVVKGMLMLWILNLMRENIGGDDNEDIITSTIKDSLNIDNDSRQDIDDKNVSVDISDQDKEIINNEFVTDLEFEMLKIVNKARQEEGLGLLEIDMKLSKVARKKAIDMINYKYFDHNSANYGTPFEMLKSEDVDYSLAGENLAESNSIKEAFQSLMNSDEHRANILNSRYDRIGIGIVEKDTDILMVVQIFIDSPDPAQ